MRDLRLAFKASRFTTIIILRMLVWVARRVFLIRTGLTTRPAFIVFVLHPSSFFLIPYILPFLLK